MDDIQPIELFRGEEYAAEAMELAETEEVEVTVKRSILLGSNQGLGVAAECADRLTLLVDPPTMARFVVCI